MLLLKILGNRLDKIEKIETARSVGSPVPPPPAQTESVFTGPNNQVVQGLTMSSLDAKPIQHREGGMRRSLVHGMQRDALDGLKYARFPAARDMKLAFQQFDGKVRYSGLEAPFTQWVYRVLRQLSHA